MSYTYSTRVYTFYYVFISISVNPYTMVGLLHNLEKKVKSHPSKCLHIQYKSTFHVQLALPRGFSPGLPHYPLSFYFSDLILWPLDFFLNIENSILSRKSVYRTPTGFNIFLSLAFFVVVFRLGIILWWSWSIFRERRKRVGRSCVGDTRSRRGPPDSLVQWGVD